MSLIKSEADLPEVNIQALKGWVLVLVEPVEQPSDVIELVHSKYDEHTSPGIGWVLSVGKYFDYLKPDEWGQKAPKVEDYVVRYQVPPELKRGAKILFRRYLRSQGLLQPAGVDSEIMREKFPGYETFFLHIVDVIGIIEDG